MGAGDLAECRGAIRDLLARPCAEEPCSLFGVYQPPVHGEFFASSVYDYATEFFGLDVRLEPAELEEAGSEFCSTSWPERVRRDPSAQEDPYLPGYCFASAYIVELLTESFGFSETTEQIRAPLRVQGADAGWTLGALLVELAGEAD